MRPLWQWQVFVYLAAAVVDEAGRYRSGTDIMSLAPPEPSADDKEAAIDLSQQPIERLFRLLQHELHKEDSRPAARRMSLREFQLEVDLVCQDRLVLLSHEAATIAADVQSYFLNMTGTSGLFWLFHKHPEEVSWIWLIAVSQDRVVRKVEHYLSRLAVQGLDDPQECLSLNFRSGLMSGVATWRRLLGDLASLIWNGIAFGMLGDVTSWREIDPHNETVEDGPGGPPPNVSWSENIIFGNMWVSSVQKWLDHHAAELKGTAYAELAQTARTASETHGQPGRPRSAPRWRDSDEGVLSSFEYLRRQTFGGWTMDKGFLRNLLRYILRPGYGGAAPVSVGDFGAGGGRYSEWLNETGLVEAFAFDATVSVTDITGGAVQEVDLASDGSQLWRTFDWVICLDVAARAPAARAAALLRSARRHATQGVVISWSTLMDEVRPSQEAELLVLAHREMGLAVDWGSTEQVREGCEIPDLARTATVLRPTGPADG